MEFPLLSILLPLIISILLILIKKPWLQSSCRAQNLPPGPWKLPIIGSLHHLYGEPIHRRLRSLAKNYGPLFHLKLGEIDVMVITSSELAAESMKTHDISFASRIRSLATKIILYDSADISFAPYGKVWAQLRKICTTELFSAKRVKYFRSIMAEDGNNLVERIRLAEGSPVNMTELLLSVANYSISRTSFGKECVQEQKLFLAVRESFKYLSGFDLPDLFPSYKFLGEITGLKRRLENIHRHLDGMLNEIFEEHEKKINLDDENEDLVDVLLRLKKSGELDSSVTFDNLKGVIVDLILGGTETTATIMEWAMAEIIRHPKVMQKVQTELRSAFNGKTKLVEQDVQNLPYLSMVLKESLRLRPPGPILVPRYSRETVQLGGYTIPAGSRVVINAWAIMRDPNYWDDAESFKPERVETNEKDFNASRFQYLPFGGGRRICPGITFGVASMEIVLANLLYHFDWKLPGGKMPEELDMDEAMGLALCKKTPLMLIATPRK